ncbi:MAG: ABC transporter substrate-binding protein [Actinomycetota bacterium]|nr:ABC transporter substrate-binding protein [Actinomycetota bacterium]
MARRQRTLIGRRAFLRGVAGVVGAATLTRCAPGGGMDGGASGVVGRPTIRVQGGSFGFPSPFAYIAAPGYWRMSYLFDTLLWPDASGRQLPWLASSYDRSDDGMVHRLALRNATWHDGTPLTPRDVVFTFDYFASQHLSPLAIAAPRSVAKAVETGERTVEIRLEHPDANFTQAVLGSVPIIPEHVWSKIDDAQIASGDEALIGTGPYHLQSRSEAHGRELYVANDDFFLGTPFVQRIEMTPVDDELVAVRAGQLDGGQAPVEGARNDVLDPFRQDPAFGVISNQTAFAFPLYFNLRRGGALADVRFRQACLMAIDREDLVQRLLTGNGTVGSAGFLPPGHPYHVEVDPYNYDPGAANRLLDDAGYRRTSPDGVRQGPDGAPLRFTLVVHDTVPPALPELVAANLRQVGVDVDRQVVDLVRLFGIKTGATYDLLINLYPGPAGTTPNGDPEILRPVYHSQPPNQLYAATGYANPEVDRLLDRQLTTLDPAERKEMVGEIQRIVARELPVAVLYYTTMFFAFRKQVFDQWYYTTGGFGPGIPDAYNKHAFVTGQKTGLQIRQASGQ